MKTDSSARQITTLLDHDRDGQFIYAYCPVCDHVAETAVLEGDREKAAIAGVDIIRVHLQQRHAPKKILTETSASPNQRQDWTVVSARTRQ